MTDKDLKTLERTWNILSKGRSERDLFSKTLLYLSALMF